MTHHKTILSLIIFVYVVSIIGHYYLLVTKDKDLVIWRLQQKVDLIMIKHKKLLDEITKVGTQKTVMTEKRRLANENMFNRVELVLQDLEMYKAGLGGKLSKETIHSELVRRLSTSLTRLSYQQEKRRRRVESLFKELWWFIESNQFEAKGSSIGTPQNTSAPTKRGHPKSINSPAAPIASKKLTAEVRGYKRSISHALDDLRAADGLEGDRLAASLELGALVQGRMKASQNPENCSSARYLYCPKKSCGFGCMLHHHIQCMIVAYATERVLITAAREHHFSNQSRGQQEDIFRPTSERCGTKEHVSSVYDAMAALETEGSNGVGDKERVLRYAIIEMVPESKKKLLPLAVPTDLAPRLTLFHGNPPAWWVGQVAAYITRPTFKYQQDLNELRERLGLTGHYVGIHVRRTDKISEAAYHDLEEYMVHVEEYFDQMETPLPKRVYLASDENLINEARSKFPLIEFVRLPKVDTDRISAAGLKDLFTDVYFLSRSQYLVCTFSSQVCRLAYELMQTLHGDASARFRSLDDIYYFGGQTRHLVRALEPSLIEETPQGERMIRFDKGDFIETAGNHWNGYSKGKHVKTQLIGLYPTYKTEDVLEYVCMLEYPHVLSSSSIPYI